MLTIRQQVHVPEVTQHDATISKLLNSTAALMRLKISFETKTRKNLPCQPLLPDQ